MRHPHPWPPVERERRSRFPRDERRRTSGNELQSHGPRTFVCPTYVHCWPELSPDEREAASVDLLSPILDAVFLGGNRDTGAKGQASEAKLTSRMWNDIRATHPGFQYEKLIWRTEFPMMSLSDRSLEEHKIDAIAEQLVGFIWDEVINVNGEFHYPDSWDHPDNSSRRSSFARPSSSALPSSSVGPSRRS